MRKIHIGILVLVILALCLPSVQAIPDQATQRLIVHTTAPFEKGVFQHQGCTIVHELNDATAIECPAGVFVPNAEPDEILQILDTTSDAQIHADDVWALSPSITGAGVVVAVLDTGVDYTHPELAPYSTGTAPVINGGIGGGKSFVRYTTSFKDDHGHGTHVSGIITADGVVAAAKGVAPGATVWMAKVCDRKGSCYTSDMVTAIEYVVDNEIAKVMSISIGGGGTTDPNCDDNDYLAGKINWANQNGVVAVIAAGNGGTDVVESPACASTAIAVAAVDSTDTLAYFSSYGNGLMDHGVAAPGVSIYSTLPRNTYASWSGTSMATPHVSALAALMLQKTPGLSASDLRSGIFNSADCVQINNYGSCPNIKIGFGRVNALVAVGGGSSPEPSLIVTASPSTITVDQTTTITATTSDGSSQSITFDITEGSGSLGASSCTGASCTVLFTPSSPGSVTITASAAGYASGSTQVTVTDSSTCVKVPSKCNCDGVCHKKESPDCGDC
jgi:subtilisin family serine protease